MTKIVIPDAAVGGHQAPTEWDNLMDPARNALEALIAKGDEMADRIEELETKLAKAVEALEHIAAEASVLVRTKKRGGVKYKWLYRSWRKIAVDRGDIARTTLAELKGGKDE